MGSYGYSFDESVQEKGYDEAAVFDDALWHSFGSRVPKIDVEIKEAPALKLYLVTRNDYTNYDEYYGFVVAAYNKQDARYTSPFGQKFAPGSDYWAADIKDVIVNEIGIASSNITAGVVFASFRGS